ncbi:hypothetical protein BX600DRAFT_474376, partial [Xylariales sp. PMI_506]
MSQTTSTFSAGGPLFRRPGTTHQDFSKAWRRHAQLVSPWFLRYCVVEYIQIHLPETPLPNDDLPQRQQHEEDAIAEPTMKLAEEILRQADGIAVVRGLYAPAKDGTLRPFGSSNDHAYFAEFIAPDERRFLHTQSGATGVKADPPAFDVPDLPVDVWRELGLRMGGVEEVKIREAQAVIEGLWWDEWRKVDEREDVQL